MSIKKTILKIGKKYPFFEINIKKFVLLIAFLAFIPLPFSAGLSAGFHPFLYFLIPVLFMTILSLISFSALLFVFFLGELILLFFVSYTVVCVIYKLLLILHAKRKTVSWLSILFVSLLFLSVNLFLGGGRSWA